MNLNTFKSSCTLFTNTYKASLIVYQTALKSYTQLVLCCYHAVERNTTTNLHLSTPELLRFSGERWNCLDSCCCDALY